MKFAKKTAAMGAATMLSIASLEAQTPGSDAESANSESPSAEQRSPTFTGGVEVEFLFRIDEPASGARVNFEAGARTAWHSHPLGQTLIVTEGTGWTQEWGGEIREIQVGDVIIVPPNVKHWHGATDVTDMSHIAIQESLNGSPVDWMEPVSDTQYLGQ